jgi:hypothetical protein
LGPSGRAGRWIGGASRRLTGRQRRRDATSEESEVEFEGQAERSVEDASRRQDREAEPEMQRPESDRLVRQAGLEGWSAAQAAGWLEGSAQGISGRRESEVRFEGGTGRLNEGASWNSAGR